MSSVTELLPLSRPTGSAGDGEAASRILRGFGRRRAWTTPAGPDTLHRMELPGSDVPPERKKKTVWLLAAGTASLLIPLAGAVYLHWSQNAGAAGPTGRSDVFERRDGEDKKILPTQTAVVMSASALTTPPPSGLIAGAAAKPPESSLDFIQSNSDMKSRINDQKAAAAPPAASTAAAAPEAPPAPAPAAKTKVKAGKKDFAMPKLQPSRGFTNFGSTGSKGGAKSGTQSGGGNSQDMLKNLPAGAASDPNVQAYLKAHQGQ